MSPPYPVADFSISVETRLPDLNFSSSPALQRLPPRSYPGEARLPLHAEPLRPGLRRGGGHGRLRGRELQREYCASCQTDAIQAG